MTTQKSSEQIIETWKEEETVAENKYFFAVYDAFPVNPGHVLIISKRPVVNMFELTEGEFVSLREILLAVKEHLQLVRKPDGYNIGANCGVSAGQSVIHFHLHVIPRYLGDVEDPRGGVRNLKTPIVDY